MALRSDRQDTHILLVIGRKSMLDHPGMRYFAFVDGIAECAKVLLSKLSTHHYETKTRGERELPSIRCLGEGKYLLIEHEKHSHLFYQLVKPAIGDVQEEFSIKERDDFIINVKNPLKPYEGRELTSKQKAEYPQELQNTFNDYRFIPLKTPEFLECKGAEILLISKNNSTENTQKENALNKCIKSICRKDILNKFEEMGSYESIIPILEKNGANSYIFLFSKFKC